MVRIITYKTRLTAEKRVALEKEISVNRPDVEGVIRSPENVAEIAKGYLRIHEEPEEYMYMICMNTKNKIIGVFEISHGMLIAPLLALERYFRKHC